MKKDELKKVKNSLSSIKDFDDLLNSLLTQTRKAIPSDAGSIYIGARKTTPSKKT